MTRRKGKGTAGNRLRLPALVATAAAPAVAYFVVRSAALAMSGPVALAAGTSLYPSDYSAQARALVRLSQQPDQPLGADALEVARRAARDMPLAYEPFFIAAKAAERSKDFGRALLLMEEAKRRRPNYTPTRLQLLYYYGRKLDHAAFVREIDYVVRRSETARSHLLPEMVKGIAEPRGREALASLLAKEPSWREDFLKIAADRKVDPRHAASLLELVRAHKPNGDLRLEQNFYVQSLVAAGNYAAAHREWSRMVKGAPTGGNLLFDGGFTGSSAPPPFNWVLKELDVGRATTAGDNSAPHLEVEYFGGKSAILAEQILALPPGRYQIQLAAASEAPPEAGSISWRLLCLPGQSEVGRVDLNNLTAQPLSLGGQFTVPAGCGGQSLRLMAEPADLARPVNLKVSRLSVRRVD